MIRVKKILYPTDFSSYSNQAYFHALELAESHQAELSVVYVCRPEQADQRAFWANQLESIRPTNPRITVEHVLLMGDPATEISRYAAEAGTDMIVMGTHGRTGPDQQQLESVAERVFRESSCSVLVVKLGHGRLCAARSVITQANSLN